MCTTYKLTAGYCVSIRPYNLKPTEKLKQEVSVLPGEKHAHVSAFKYLVSAFSMVRIYPQCILFLFRHVGKAR